MAARSQGEPDGQAAKWSDRRTDSRTDADAGRRTAYTVSIARGLAGAHCAHWALGLHVKHIHHECQSDRWQMRLQLVCSPISPPHLPLPCPALASRLPWPYVIRKGKRTNENFPIIADTARTRPQRKFNALNCPRSRALCPRCRVACLHFSCSLSKWRILDVNANHLSTP